MLIYFTNTRILFQLQNDENKNQPKYRNDITNGEYYGKESCDP